MKGPAAWLSFAVVIMSGCVTDDCGRDAACGVPFAPAHADVHIANAGPTASHVRLNFTWDSSYLHSRTVEVAAHSSASVRVEFSVPDRLDAYTLTAEVSPQRISGSTMLALNQSASVRIEAGAVTVTAT